MAAPGGAVSDSESSSSSDAEELARCREAAMPAWGLEQRPRGAEKPRGDAANNKLPASQLSLRHKVDEHEQDGNELQTTPEFRAHIAKKLGTLLDSSITISEVVKEPRTAKEHKVASEDDGFRLFFTSIPGGPEEEASPRPHRKRQPSSSRSLNMDFENQDKEKDNNSSSGSFNGNSTNNSIQTIDSTQALFLPIGASVSLLVMFFFFDSVQVVFTICTAVLATIAFAFLLLPMCQYLTRPCSPQNKISFGCCGRFTAAELLSFSLSVMLVLIWVLTGHWLLMDALAMGLCVAMIAFVRLPSLKVSCLLLSGLLIYDVFWVFFSAYIFNSNVMVKVATQPADNPLDVLSRKLHLGPNVGRDVPRLSLPGKLVFPSSTGSHFSMLGIGDIVMPGLLLCFVLRYDNYKKQASGDSCGASGPANISGRMQKVSYFHCTLIGYFVGLLTATVASRIHRAAQPALLYLVPFTLLPLLTMAYLKGDLRRMWSEPFHSKSSSSRFLEV
ncbi:Signal peptide peptidase-like 3 [Sciurus carolinensis]|uniref:Signal peptide peptidase-like 3 n=2 Tax=Sciuridae TaxID=55153 RepID=A0AA41N004_SCICA|nr:Signal peptide peptidase-like 3 [Sciurus carolinensis]